MKPIRNGSPIIAFLLNCACLVGGLGYLYLGQLKKALVTFGIVAGLLLLEWILAHYSLGHTVIVLNPIVWAFMVLTALDASMLASRARRGDEVLRGDVALPLLGWMGRRI